MQREMEEANNEQKAKETAVETTEETPIVEEKPKQMKQIISKFIQRMIFELKYKIDYPKLFDWIDFIKLICETYM
jgi:hypothetical protein